MRIKLLKHIVIIVALITTLPLWATTSLCNRYASTSKLASGRWVKIEIGASGIYQIPYSTLQSMGFDPTKVKVYGYGGNMLPEKFSEPYIDDLPEIPILRDKNRILFYGEGTVKWTNNGINFSHETSSQLLVRMRPL